MCNLKFPKEEEIFPSVETDLINMSLLHRTKKREWGIGDIGYLVATQSLGKGEWLGYCVTHAT